MGKWTPWPAERAAGSGRTLQTRIAFFKVGAFLFLFHDNTYASALESFEGPFSNLLGCNFPDSRGNWTVPVEFSAGLNGMSWSTDSVKKWTRTPALLLDAGDHHITKLEPSWGLFPLTYTHKFYPTECRNNGKSLLYELLQKSDFQPLTTNPDNKHHPTVETEQIWTFRWFFILWELKIFKFKLKNS